MKSFGWDAKANCMHRDENVWSFMVGFTNGGQLKFTNFTLEPVAAFQIQNNLHLDGNLINEEWSVNVQSE